MLDAVAAELARIDAERTPSGEVYERCRAADHRTALVRRTHAWYAAKYDQRLDGAATVLRAADEVIRSCWTEAFGALARPAPTGPLAYLDPRFDATATPRVSVPADLRAPGDAVVGELVRELPIPVVALPAFCVDEPWWLVLAAHETGHHVQHDLAPGLVAATRDALAAAAGEHGAFWAGWSMEAFADAFAALTVGPAAAWAVDELQHAPPTRLLTAPSPGSRYPPPPVRTALLGELARAAGAANVGPGADDVLGWVAEFAAHEEVAAHVRLTPRMAAALVDLPVAGVPLRAVCGWEPSAFDDRRPGGRVGGRHCAPRARSSRAARAGRRHAHSVAGGVEAYRALAAATEDPDGLRTALPAALAPAAPPASLRRHARDRPRRARRPAGRPPARRDGRSGLMHRIVVRVDEAAAGWQVTVCSGGDELATFPTTATALDGRRVPGTPPERAPAPDQPHAALCAGDAGELTALLDRIRPASAPAPATWRPTGAGCSSACSPRCGRGCRPFPRSPARTPSRSRCAGPPARRAPPTGVGGDARPGRPLAGPSLRRGGDHPVGARPPGQVRTVTGVPSVLFATSVALTDPTIRPGAMYMGLLRELDLAGPLPGAAPSRRLPRRPARRRTRAGVRTSSTSSRTVCAAPTARRAILLAGDGGAEREADADGAAGRRSPPTGERPVAVVLSVCNTGSPGEARRRPRRRRPARRAAGRRRDSDRVGDGRGDPRVGVPALHPAARGRRCTPGSPVVTASAHGTARRPDRQRRAQRGHRLGAAGAVPGRVRRPGTSRLVDAATRHEAHRPVRRLGLRREPVFIGREEVLAGRRRRRGAGAARLG